VFQLRDLKIKKGISITNNNVGGNAAGSQTLYIDNSSGTGIQIKNFQVGLQFLQNRRNDLLNAETG
jgi:hypothetical protein